MTEREKEIVLALARNDMNVSKTAKDLHFHRNNMTYHIEHITKKYNLDPRKFYDLIQLIEAARGGD